MDSPHTAAGPPRVKREPFASICPFSVPEAGANETWDEIQGVISSAFRNNPQRLDAREWRFVTETNGLRLLSAPQLRKYVAIFRKLAAIEAAETGGGR